jgi:hypothetical protein
MAPHIKIEERLNELAGATEQTFSVSAVPDEKKGERIIVLHTLTDEELAPVLMKLAESRLAGIVETKERPVFSCRRAAISGNWQARSAGAQDAGRCARRKSLNVKKEGELPDGFQQRAHPKLFVSGD